MNAPEGNADGVLSVVLAKTVDSIGGVELGDSAVLDGGMLDSMTVADSAIVLVASICDETPGKMVSLSDIVMGAPELEASTALVGRPLAIEPSVALGTSVGRPLVTGLSVLVASVGKGTPENIVSLSGVELGTPVVEASAALVSTPLASPFVTVSTVVLVASVCVGNIVSVSEIVIGAPRSVVVDVGVGKPSVKVVGVPFGMSVAVVVGCSLKETGTWVDIESVSWPVEVSVVVPVGAAVARGSSTIDDDAARELLEDVGDGASPVPSTPVDGGASDTAEPPITRFKV